MLKSSEDRIFVDAFNCVCNDPEYVEYLTKIIKLGQTIMDRLDPMTKTLFMEYERLTGLAHGVYLESAYQTGYKDGQEQSLNIKQNPA